VTDSTVRALVVEDDRSWQQLLTEILTDLGLRVDVTEDFGGAIEALRAHPHRLAVVDLSLSGRGYHNQDGLRVLQAVRRQDPGCAAVMLTGFATVELAVSALNEYGAFSCLRKEAFNRGEFREVVKQALASTPPIEAGAGEAEQSPQGQRPAGEAEAALDEELPAVALVVEDDAGWRSILSELLGDAGYQVRLCSSYGQALGLLRRDTYALAVVDLSLADSTLARGAFWSREPGGEELDGYRLLASVRAGGVPAIVVSGVGTPEDIDRAYAEHGIFAYLEKQTFDRRAFLDTVREARAATRVPSGLESLTEREREVLELLARGMTNKEMAEALFITANTVKRHLKSIFAKLEVHTRSAAAAKAVSAGVAPEWPQEDATDRE
jgi:DNA-binding NarL/FixJ family response regulator